MLNNFLRDHVTAALTLTKKVEIVKQQIIGDWEFVWGITQGSSWDRHVEKNQHTYVM